MTRSETLENRLAALESRVAALDREFVEHRDHEPDTSLQDWIDGIDRRVFSQLLRQLELVVPGFSVAQLRGDVEALEGSISLETHSGDPRAATIDLFIRRRIEEAIKEMLPQSLYEGEDPLEHAPPHPVLVLRARLEAEQQSPLPLRE